MEARTQLNGAREQCHGDITECDGSETERKEHGTECNGSASRALLTTLPQFVPQKICWGGGDGVAKARATRRLIWMSVALPLHIKDSEFDTNYHQSCANSLVAEMDFVQRQRMCIENGLSAVA